MPDTTPPKRKRFHRLNAGWNKVVELIKTPRYVGSMVGGIVQWAKILLPLASVVYHAWKTPHNHKD